ncbi:MAG: hypothetical protein FJY67_09145 [Calditrichaeota bacterium]|nr:hypothetical protein [Calditrichota bacterium]
MKHPYSFTAAVFGLLTLTAITTALGGCGGKKLVAREAEKTLAGMLGTPQHNIQISTTFRTSILRKVPRITLTESRESGRRLIEQFAAYIGSEGVGDLGNDTLVFIIRLDTDPDVLMKWIGITGDFYEVVKGKRSLDDFLEGMRKEERWSEDLG